MWAVSGLLALGGEFVAVNRGDLLGLDGKTRRIGRLGHDADLDTVLDFDDFKAFFLGDFLRGGEVASLGINSREMRDFREREDFVLVLLKSVEDGEAVGVDFGFHKLFCFLSFYTLIIRLF